MGWGDREERRVPALTRTAHVNTLDHMAKMIQLRNVPEHLHRKLRTRAARQGLSLSAYLIREIEQVANRPTIDDIRQRLRHRTPVVPPIYRARAIREERGR